MTLIRTPLNWPTSWEQTGLDRITSWLIDQYKKLPKWDESTLDSTFDSFFTPYQFTLTILQQLYHTVQGFAEEVKPESRIPLAVNPGPRFRALTEMELRAIAYCSWEPESRLFLIRRVFPTYFDFLAISHIPEGWGASSVMLEELNRRLKENLGVESGAFYTVVNLRDAERFALPYVQEKVRLRYQSIGVVPVFNREVVEDDNDLLGVFLLFLGNEGVMPVPESTEGRGLINFLKGLCRETAEVIKLHNEKLGYPGGLPDMWKTLRKDRGRGANIAKIKVVGGPADKVERVARGLLRELSKPNYHAIRADGGAVDADSIEAEAIVLVTMSQYYGGDINNLKMSILRLLIEKYSEHSLTCNVTLEDSEEANETVFCLTTACQAH